MNTAIHDPLENYLLCVSYNAHVYTNTEWYKAGEHHDLTCTNMHVHADMFIIIDGM